MSRYLFSVLFPLLLIMFCICGPAYANDGNEESRVELFVPWTTKIPSRGGEGTEKDVKQFSSPLLLSANGVMVTLTKAKYTDNGKQGNIDIVAKYIGIEGEDWVKNATENNENNWKTQLVIQNPVREQKSITVENILAVAKDGKIYLLVTGYNTSDSETEKNLDFVLTVGEVTNSTEKGTEKTINWETHKLLIPNLTQEFKRRSLSLPSQGDRSGYSFLLKDGNIVFVVGAKKDNKDAFAIIYSNGTGKETELELSHVETTEDCYPLSFFEWEGKLIMFTYCRNGGYKVKGSTDMGKTWTDVIGLISRLWYNLRDKGDFTTVTIGNKTVLLSTEVVNTGTGSEAKYEIYLWMSDGKHVYRTGSIVSRGGCVISSGLLYTNGEFFFIYQESEGFSESDRIIFTRYKDQLEKMKSVLNIWEEMDKYLSTPCNKTIPQGTLCVTPMPTDGLVGFLSNTTSDDDDNIWVDEYFYVNATVKGGTKVDNGFTFSGTNAGAQWTMGLQGQSQLYNFSRYGLTVVATVTIHNVPKSDSPLLTIDRIPSNKPLGLWYGSNKKWKVKSVDSDGAPGSGWDINKSYRVTLILQNNNVSAYVDGEQVGSLSHLLTHEQKLFRTVNIFIGGYKDEEDSEESENTEGTVTVTNVLLYNRPLNTSELKALGRKRAETIESKGHAGETIESKGHAGDTIESKGHTGQSPEGGKDLQQFLKLTNSQDSCVYMPVVTSLLCLLGLWGLTVFC